MTLAPLFGGMNSFATAFLEASPLRCQVLRQTLGDDGRGGKTETFVPIAGDPVPCLCSSISGQAHVLGAVPTGSGKYQITLPANAAVQAQDRIRILAWGTEPERTFEIDHLLHAAGVVVEVVGILRG